MAKNSFSFIRSFGEIMSSFIFICLISLTTFAQQPAGWESVEKLEFGSIVEVGYKYELIKGKIIGINPESLFLLRTGERGDSFLTLQRREIRYIYKQRSPIDAKVMQPIAATAINIISAPVGFIGEGIAGLFDNKGNPVYFLAHGLCGANHGTDFLPKGLKNKTQVNKWKLVYPISK